MNRYPKRFNHHAPNKLDYYGPSSPNNKQDYYGPSSPNNKQDYYGPCSNNAAVPPDFGVERASWSKSSGGGNGAAYEGDKYSGYPSNGEFRSTRGTGSSSGGDTLRYDPPNPKESSGSRNSFYSHEEREQGGGSMLSNNKMGEFWSERKHQSDRGMTNENNPKSRAAHHQHQQHQLPLRQQWQSNVRSSCPSKRGLRCDHHHISSTAAPSCCHLTPLI